MTNKKNRLRRRFDRSAILIAILFTCGLFQFRSASAGVIVTFAEVGNDVTATLSGSFASLPSSFYSVNGWNEQPIVRGGSDTRNIVNITDGAIKDYRWYSVAVPDPFYFWGNGPAITTQASSQTINGNGHLLFDNNREFSDRPVLLIQKDYVVGTPFNSSLTFAGATLSSLGLNNPGTYTYDLFDSNETFSVVVSTSGGGGAAVPEPSSLAIASVLGLIGWQRSRRKSKQANG